MFFILQQQANPAAAALTGIGSIVYGIVVIIFIAATWKLYMKANQPGWAAIIPIYNVVVMLHITGRSGWWILGFLVPLLNIFVEIRLLVEFFQSYGRSGWWTLSILFPPILLIIFLIMAFGSDRYVGPAAQRGSMRPATA